MPGSRPTWPTLRRTSRPSRGGSPPRRKRLTSLPPAPPAATASRATNDARLPPLSNLGREIPRGLALVEAPPTRSNRMQTHPHPGAGLYTAHAGGTSRISFAHDRDPRLVFTSRDDARQALALARDWSSETGRPVSVGLPYMKELLHVDGVMD